MTLMGYVFNFKDVKAYEAWSNLPANRSAFANETRLMMELLKPMRGRRVLDIGCGTGALMSAFMELGLSVTGIDPSPYMLDAAAAALDCRAELRRGVAEELPFDDNAFHYVCMVKTLSFVDNPRAAISEAFRVAKDRVFIGILHRPAIAKMRRFIKRSSDKASFEGTRLVGVRELKKIARNLLGDVPITQRTLHNLPLTPEAFTRHLENASPLNSLLFGYYTGMVITPVPRFRTRPLQVPCAAKPRAEGVVG